MSLNIKSTETHLLVQELAALTGETQTMAVTRPWPSSGPGSDGSPPLTTWRPRW